MKYFPIFIGLIFFIVLVSILKVSCEKVEESWINFKGGPYSNFHTTNNNQQYFIMFQDIENLTDGL